MMDDDMALFGKDFSFESIAEQKNDEDDKNEALKLTKYNPPSRNDILKLQSP